MVQRNDKVIPVPLEIVDDGQRRDVPTTGNFSLMDQQFRERLEKIAGSRISGMEALIRIEEENNKLLYDTAIPVARTRKENTIGYLKQQGYIQTFPGEEEEEPEGDKVV